MEAHIHVQYTDMDKTGRFKVRRWCGDHPEVSLTSDMMENLRGSISSLSAMPRRAFVLTVTASWLDYFICLPMMQVVTQ